jgi:hypothetical protein
MRTRPMLVATALSAFLVLGAAPAMAAPTTDRASLSTANVQSNSSSVFSSISKDGKIVAFDSSASNLVANDLNGSQDIFVRNRPSGKTTRVSRRSNGGEANGLSTGPHLSETGRFVAFTSSATNLIGLDGNSATDVFVHDRVSKKTKRVSTRSNGAEANGSSVLQGISADGRYVVFNSLASNLVAGDSNGVHDVFVKDRKSGKTTRVSRRTNGSQGNGTSYYAAISPNGRYVAFLSDSTNLVPNDSNGTGDVFVHDRKSKKTVRVSIASNGAQGNSSSFWPDVANNGSVAFPSFASNLVSNDTNANWDVFLHDLGTRKTRRVSVSSAGAQGNNTSGLFVGPPKLSADGKRIAFDSSATNLVAGDTNAVSDVFLHNRANQTTRRVSVRFDGTQANNQSFVADISSGGRFATFLSNATNLVGGDTNAQYDVFVRGPFN